MTAVPGGKFRETGGPDGLPKIAPVSLYRTWRPKSFSDLVGQEAVVRTLRTALETGKLAHAYLFSGPRGSGKTSAAKILARCIDCESGPTPEPDNTCENCRAMLAGTALDVVEIDAASNRGINEIRELREAAKFAPASMRSKVFIIDEAHMLTREGANAFLKTLEEPPPHVVFILATTAPESLPATILSRCQRYAFRRIPAAVMIERMREIAKAEGIAAGDDALAAIAYRADGGLRDALTMLEQVAAFAGPPGTPIDAGTVDGAFGLTGRHFALAMVRAILEGRAAEALRAVDEASDAGADMLGLIRGAIAEYRALLVARVDPELLARDLSTADADAAIALASATAGPKIVRGLQVLGEALAQGRFSGNPRLELETALLRLVLAAEDATLAGLSARLAALEGGSTVPSAPDARASAPRAPEPRGAAPRAPEPRDAAVRAPEHRDAAARAPKPRDDASSAGHADAAPGASTLPAPPKPDVAENAAARSESAPAEPTLQSVRLLWDQIRLRVEEGHKPLRGPLAQATVDALEAGTLTIGIVDSVQEAIVRAKLPLLEQAVADVLRKPVRVVLRSRLVTGTASRKAESAPEPGGEIDLLAYARRKVGGMESS